jgi:hypothetical protein
MNRRILLLLTIAVLCSVFLHRSGQRITKLIQIDSVGETKIQLFTSKPFAQVATSSLHQITKISDRSAVVTITSSTLSANTQYITVRLDGVGYKVDIRRDKSPIFTFARDDIGQISEILRFDNNSQKSIYTTTKKILSASYRGDGIAVLESDKINDGLLINFITKSGKLLENKKLRGNYVTAFDCSIELNSCLVSTDLDGNMLVEPSTIIKIKPFNDNDFVIYKAVMLSDQTTTLFSGDDGQFYLIDLVSKNVTALGIYNRFLGESSLGLHFENEEGYTVLGKNSISTKIARKNLKNYYTNVSPKPGDDGYIAINYEQDGDSYMNTTVSIDSNSEQLSLYEAPTDYMLGNISSSSDGSKIFQEQWSNSATYDQSKFDSIPSGLQTVIISNNYATPTIITGRVIN